MIHQRLAMLARRVAQDWSACQDLLLYSLLKIHACAYLKPVIGINMWAEFDPEINANLSAMMPDKSALIDLDAFEKADNGLEYVADLDTDIKRRLLSVCTALLLQSNSAVYQAYLAERTGCDPVRQWRPTADNFWNRLTKKQILLVGTEVLGERWAKAHSENKKSDLTRQMEQIFAGHTLPGIRADQTARALAWLPASMAFGNEVELPPLDDSKPVGVIQVIESEGVKIARALAEQRAKQERENNHHDVEATSYRIVIEDKGGHLENTFVLHAFCDSLPSIGLLGGFW